MSRENIPSIITNFFREIICSNCGCEIDVEGIDPFTKLECPKCESLQIVSAGFDSFVLYKILGSGQMGSVYAARDNKLNRNVAIKVMLPDLTEDQEFVDTFAREAQALAQINHPNVAQIYSFGEKNGQQYLVMELVKGKKLEDLMKGRKKVNQALAMHVGLQVVKGLQVVGEVGLVHGDVKPENIIVDENLNAKLVDFGLAVFNEDGPRDEIWGSPYYISPENIEYVKSDVRSDIYSLGATLYHALAGRPPFLAPTTEECIKARLKRSPRDIALCCRDIDPAVRNIIMRMLERDPARRYPASCTSLIGDMTKALKDLGGVRKSLSSKVRIKTKTRISASVKAKTKILPSSASVGKPGKSRNPLKAIMITVFIVTCLAVVVSVYMEEQRNKKALAGSGDTVYVKGAASQQRGVVGTTLSTIKFSNGVSPVSWYKGVEDTYLEKALSEKGRLSTKPAGKFRVLKLGKYEGGLPGSGAFFNGVVLLKWDVSTVPRGSGKVKAVSVSLKTTGSNSKEAYSIYSLKRDWDEDEALWDVCKKGSKWGEPGAKSDSDRGPLLGQFVPGKKVQRNTAHLNKAGVAVVQEWLDNPSRNYGLIIGKDGASEGVNVLSSDVDEKNSRPELIITYYH